jgi:hypothetical protein
MIGMVWLDVSKPLSETSGDDGEGKLNGNRDRLEQIVHEDLALSESKAIFEVAHETSPRNCLTNLPKRSQRRRTVKRSSHLNRYNRRLSYLSMKTLEDLFPLIATEGILATMESRSYEWRLATHGDGYVPYITTNQVREEADE